MKQGIQRAFYSYSNWQNIMIFNCSEQGWAITFLSGPVADNELNYWAEGSKLNIETRFKNNLFTNN